MSECVRLEGTSQVGGLEMRKQLVYELVKGAEALIEFGCV